MSTTTRVAVAGTITELRAAVAEQRARGFTIALVPTMGALHPGHLSLIERASREADFVIVSIFVNPTQFNDRADLASYPRELDGDCHAAGEAGADLIFAPPADEIYPAGFATEVRVSGRLTDSLEGAHRGVAHFHGVTTVVTKLLNIAQADVAVFGAKDAQQLRVIERVTSDLDIPTRVACEDTVREPDGLAMSSRNARLDPPSREQAVGISEALHAVTTQVADGVHDADTLIATAQSVLEAREISPEYVAICDPKSLAPIDRIPDDGTALLLIAATVGGVRLIDNTLLGSN